MALAAWRGSQELVEGEFLQKLRFLLWGTGICFVTAEWKPLQRLFSALMLDYWLLPQMSSWAALRKGLGRAKSFAVEISVQLGLLTDESSAFLCVSLTVYPLSCGPCCPVRQSCSPPAGCDGACVYLGTLKAFISLTTSLRKLVAHFSPSLELLKARLDGAVNNLVCWGHPCPWQGVWVVFKDPSNRNHSMAPVCEVWVKSWGNQGTLV